MQEKKRVIVAPLDWGLGHATRCIPVIRELLRHDVEVIIAADGRAALLLKEEFPQLTHVHLSGYKVRYSSSFSMMLSMALQIPKIIFAIRREHSQLKKIIQQYQPQAIISDNRYGLWNKKIYSVFITHQLMVKCPKPLSFLESILHRIILSYVNRYHECWIPDVDGEENISVTNIIALMNTKYRYSMFHGVFGLGLFITRQLLVRDNCSISLDPARNEHGRLYRFVVSFSGAKG